MTKMTMKEHALSKRRKVKITVIRRSEVDATPLTLAAPLGPCDLFAEGQEILIENGRMPEGFCQSAWVTLYPDIETLAWGGEFPWYNEKASPSDAARMECDQYSSSLNACDANVVVVESLKKFDCEQAIEHDAAAYDRSLFAEWRHPTPDFSPVRGSSDRVRNGCLFYCTFQKIIFNGQC